jgi:hypothetical protein
MNRETYYENKHNERITRRWNSLDQEGVIASELISNFFYSFSFINEESIRGNTARAWAELLWWKQFGSVFYRAQKQNLFNQIKFPIIRRVYAGMIANEIISVQPMSLPSAGVFFMDYSYAKYIPGIMSSSFQTNIIASIV